MREYSSGVREASGRRVKGQKSSLAMSYWNAAMIQSQASQVCDAKESSGKLMSEIDRSVSVSHSFSAAWVCLALQSKQPGHDERLW